MNRQANKEWRYVEKDTKTDKQTHACTYIKRDSKRQTDKQRDRLRKTERDGYRK